jgi:serine/threonine-protein kinase RIO1
MDQKPNLKSSYESNADVQRWLQEQSLEGGSKPEFHPTFLAGQRDRFWILSSLAQFYEQDLITDVLRVIKSGKEATVYCCAAQVTNWIEYEFQTQRLLSEAGADVPCPWAQVGNAVLMDYVGDAEDAAPLLREVDLPREEAQPLFDAILRNIELFLACDRVHGDLSEYNILYWQGAAKIIDFAQAVDPRYNSDDVFDLLARDIERVCRYGARYGVEADAEALAVDLWTRYLTGALA